jgi:hypothetical protein
MQESNKTMVLRVALATLLVSGCYTTFEPVGDALSDSGGDGTGDGGGDTTHDTAVDTSHDSAPDSSDVVVDVTPPPCGGGMPDTCPAGTFCELPGGLCDIWMYTGSCVEIPAYGCPEYYSPVCGCDGMTYDNDCYRRQAAVSLAYDGACGGVACAPWLEECPPGTMCEAQPDSCWMDGVMGVCTTILTGCGYLRDPSCGCDGVTYANECERMAFEVWLDHRGECGAQCGDATSPPCPTGSFCEWPTSSCGDWGPAECIIVPLGCPDLWDPVCGCDGFTYPNDCDRQSARVQLAYRGSCG